MSGSQQDKRLTMQAAADLLNVSADYVRRLVADGRLTVLEGASGDAVLRKAAVLAFKTERDARRDEALGKLIRLSEEYGAYEPERYSEERIEEFLEADALPAELAERARERLK